MKKSLKKLRTVCQFVKLNDKASNYYYILYMSFQCRDLLTQMGTRIRKTVVPYIQVFSRSKNALYISNGTCVN